MRTRKPAVSWVTSVPLWPVLPGRHLIAVDQQPIALTPARPAFTAIAQPCRVTWLAWSWHFFIHRFDVALCEVSAPLRIVLKALWILSQTRTRRPMVLGQSNEGLLWLARQRRSAYNRSPIDRHPWRPRLIHTPLAIIHGPIRRSRRSRWLRLLRIRGVLGRPRRQPVIHALRLRSQSRKAD